MNDLTLLYYTANLIPEFTAEKIRKNLIEVTKNKFPVISVSQKPINFGKNLCVGEIGQSIYNCYKQILAGAEKVDTKFVACCEDDTLYTPEHFDKRPSSEKAVAYNTNTWIAAGDLFWRHKDMSNMSFHICPTKLLIETLAVRYKLFPHTPKDQRHFIEPGKFDTDFGIPNVPVETFATKLPVVTFEFRGSISGKRKRFGLTDPNSFCYDLLPFGNAHKLYHEYWGD